MSGAPTYTRNQLAHNLLPQTKLSRAEQSPPICENHPEPHVRSPYSFGNEGNDNGEKLQAFIETVNSSDNSHLVTVPAGTILSDMLFGSPIYQQDGGAGYSAGGGGAEVNVLPAEILCCWFHMQGGKRNREVRRSQ